MPDNLETLNNAANILQKADVSSIITALSLGIAKAQEQLDDNSIRQLIKLSEQEVAGKSLLELGFVPAFYQFEYADVSASINLQMQASESLDVSASLKIDYAKSKGYSKEDLELIEKSKQDKHRKEFKSSRSVTMRADESKTVKIQNKTVSMDQQKGAIEKVEDFADRMREAESVSRVETKTSTDLSLSGVTVSNGAWINHYNGYISIYAPTASIKSGILQIKDYTVSGTNEFNVVGANDMDIAASYAATKANALNLLGGLGANNKIFFYPFKSEVNDALSIYFAYDKYEKIDESYSESTYNNVDAIAKLVPLQTLLAANPQFKIEIVGHTDSSGKVEYNKALGKHRATTVANFFPQKYQDNGQISISTQGEALALTEGDNLRNPKYRKVSIKLNGALADYIYFQGANFSVPGDAAENITLAGTNGYVFKDPGAAINPAVTFTYDGTTVTLGNTGSATQFDTDFNASFASNVFSKQKIKDTYYLLHKKTKVEFIAYNAESNEILIEEVSSSQTNSSQSSDTLLVDDTANSDYYMKKDAETIKNPSSLAVNIAVDVRTSKAYSISMEGTAAVSARLRALPPPPEFKAYITSLINP